MLAADKPNKHEGALTFAVTRIPNLQALNNAIPDQGTFLLRIAYAGPTRVLMSASTLLVYRKCCWLPHGAIAHSKILQWACPHRLKWAYIYLSDGLSGSRWDNCPRMPPAKEAAAPQTSYVPSLPVNLTCTSPSCPSRFGEGAASLPQSCLPHHHRAWSAEDASYHMAQDRHPSCAAGQQKSLKLCHSAQSSPLVN